MSVPDGLRGVRRCFGPASAQFFLTITHVKERRTKPEQTYPVNKSPGLKDGKAYTVHQRLPGQLVSWEKQGHGELA